MDVEETGSCSSSDPGIQGESDLKCISEKSGDSTSLYMRVSFVLSQSRESFDFWSRCGDFRNYLRTIYSVRFRLTRVRICILEHIWEFIFCDPRSCIFFCSCGFLVSE